MWFMHAQIGSQAGTCLLTLGTRNWHGHFLVDKPDAYMRELVQ